MKLNLGYFPGCSGLGTSKEYEASTRAVCQELGITLKEIPDWNCCGSTPAHTVDHVLSAALASRVFAQAETVGISDVVTPCPSCLKNLRNCLDHMDDPLFAARVEALTGRPLKREHSIKSVLQVISEDIGTEALGPHIRRSLKGLKVVPYYGCLMTRPGEVMRFDNPENPTSMDRLLEALGAEVLPFPLKTDCCGASFAIPDRNVVPRLSGRILDMAVSLGADAIVVACPLCQMNLDLRQGQINAKKETGGNYKIPVPYFTQLMAYAFGLPDAAIAFNMLAVNMQPAFAKMQERAAEITRQEREAKALKAEKARAAAEKAEKARQAAEARDAEATGAEQATEGVVESAAKSARESATESASELGGGAS